MNQNIQATTVQIDFGALNVPLSDADIRAYKQFKTGNREAFEIRYKATRGRNRSINSYIILGMGAVILVLFLLFVGITLVEGSALAVFIWIPIIIGVATFVYMSALANTKRRARLYKFAIANGLSYVVDLIEPAYNGMIYDEGHSRSIVDALVFPDRAEIGNYQYTTGGGKNSTTHEWAYTRVKLPRKLPHMVMDSKKNNIMGFSNLSDSFSKAQTLSLEGDFDKHFTLYAPKEYERDALYIFTPDVMANLIDNGNAYDIEVIGDELYIYQMGHIALDSEATLRQQLTIVDIIARDLHEASDYYADERVGSRAQNVIAAPGARLKRGISWLKVFLFTSVVLVALVQIALFLIPFSQVFHYR